MTAPEPPAPLPGEVWREVDAEVVSAIVVGHNPGYPTTPVALRSWWIPGVGWEAWRESESVSPFERWALAERARADRAEAERDAAIADSVTRASSVAALLAEREECAARLDEMAQQEDEGRAFARANGNAHHESMARSMAKAYRSGAAAIRARGGS